MANTGLCGTCGKTAKLTAKNQVVVKHYMPSVGTALKPPACKGSGKLPRLWRPALCDTCHEPVRLMVDSKLSKHNDPKEGVECVASLTEAAATLIEELGAVEVDGSATFSTRREPSPMTSSPDGTSRSCAEVVENRNTSSTTGTIPSVPPSGISSSGSSSIPAAVSAPSQPGADTATSSTPSSADMFGAASTPVRAKPRKRQVLEGRAAELASQMKEVWWASQSRSERTLQTAIGPSEIGLDCMRRLAMKISGMPQVNHEGHPWAAWVGTAMHSAYEIMFTEASGTSGRWITETKVEIGSTVVPKGTADLFDRHLHRVIDHKNMGKSTLSKAWLDGPSKQYETQLHVYGLGLERMGEDVREVALVAWPREGNTLDDMYAWVADYDRDVALAAITRVESIARRLGQLGEDGWRQAPKTPSFGCKFCPFYLPGDKVESRGCSA